VELHPEEIAVKAERFLHVFNGYREVFDSPDGHGFLLSLSGVMVRGPASK